ncbi:hypothetical protein DFH09DRAFT_1311389 [Mycena vulgaris]|nr:hypothetical protein DFH09DRAFT_1311389 [Mycena vulgaris]
MSRSTRACTSASERRTILKPGGAGADLEYLYVRRQFSLSALTSSVQDRRCAFGTELVQGSGHLSAGEIDCRCAVGISSRLGASERTRMNSHRLLSSACRASLLARLHPRVPLPAVEPQPTLCAGPEVTPPGPQTAERGESDIPSFHYCFNVAELYYRDGLNNTILVFTFRYSLVYNFCGGACLYPSILGAYKSLETEQIPDAQDLCCYPDW